MTGFDLYIAAMMVWGMYLLIPTCTEDAKDKMRTEDGEKIWK